LSPRFVSRCRPYSSASLSCALCLAGELCPPSLTPPDVTFFFSPSRGLPFDSDAYPRDGERRFFRPRRVFSPTATPCLAPSSCVTRGFLHATLAAGIVASRSCVPRAPAWNFFLCRGHPLFEHETLLSSAPCLGFEWRESFGRCGIGGFRVRGTCPVD